MKTSKLYGVDTTMEIIVFVLYCNSEQMLDQVGVGDGWVMMGDGWVMDG